MLGDLPPFPPIVGELEKDLKKMGSIIHHFNTVVVVFF